MPLFEITQNNVKLVKPKNFSLEKEIQNLIEKNLETVFNCRFVATEFSTGAEHSGRIDSLALSEDNNPVIIEYKKVESSELVNQSLYYLAWIKDHKGDFELEARKQLGDVKIDWSGIRVICIAPGYKKYDLYAVQAMGANIELWQYHLYENNTLHLEEVFRRSASGNENKISIGKKASETNINESYTFEEHLNKHSEAVKSLANDVRDYILSIDESVEESPKKMYIAYKVAQNFVCMELHKNKVMLFLKLKPSNFTELPMNARDVSNIGHYGTGNFEITLKNTSDLENAKQYIQQSFEEIGG